MSVKNQFSIKDLENLSNVKAHTIRMWEKRYDLLQPDRTDTNIRTYDLVNLRKLLNVSYLYNEGYKISKIAKLSDNEIRKIVQTKTATRKEDSAINSFKNAMFSFSSEEFNYTFNDLAQNYSFRHIFFEVFIPLLNDIGQLWQTKTIDSAHESFISELIKRKITINIDDAQNKFVEKNKTKVVLFLPYEEIHEIGLLYTYYELIKAGYQTVYLGSNIPLDSLNLLLAPNEDIIFLSYLTVQPQNLSLISYIEQFQTSIAQQQPCQLWLMGQKTKELDKTQLDDNIKIINTLDTLFLSLTEQAIS